MALLGGQCRDLKVKVEAENGGGRFQPLLHLRQTGNADGELHQDIPSTPSEFIHSPQLNTHPNLLTVGKGRGPWNTFGKLSKQSKLSTGYVTQ
jgi:hypothetical protein